MMRGRPCGVCCRGGALSAALVHVYDVGGVAGDNVDAVQHTPSAVILNDVDVDDAWTRAAAWCSVTSAAAHALPPTTIDLGPLLPLASHSQCMPPCHIAASYS